MNQREERQGAQLRRGLFGLINKLKETFDVDDLKKARQKIIEMNQRITDLEALADQARTKLIDHEQRIKALEEAQARSSIVK